MVLISGIVLKRFFLSGAVQDGLAMTTGKKCLCQIHNEEDLKCPVWLVLGGFGLCSGHAAPAM